jgi:lipoate-protein ligase A
MWWRQVPYAVHSAARNMALDEALARSLAEPGRGVVRLYGWQRPTLSLGKNEPTAPYPLALLRAAGHDIVRRPTGGRAVLHHLELTYAVVAPLRTWGGVRDAYVAINEALASALRSLGATVDVVPEATGGRSLGPEAGPCFQVPAAGEVVARGRKIVGSAQARIGDALLQHGSILLAGDQGALAGDAPPITLSELIGDVSIDEVAGVVADRFRAELGGRWSEGEITVAEHALADRLESERYALDSWTHRR